MAQSALVREIPVGWRDRIMRHPWLCRIPRYRLCPRHAAGVIHLTDLCQPTHPLRLSFA
ncbi:hypothetical protein KL86PLE_90550 [uncultured Pleomorphomonas sp.]|uniref:Uncharacterized protein n=1 Tax=uncultured Pleomorphomonas sp. TaxID=442121 RepID=A0A212LQ55_9HYPH|nr:hypothetical protein KL86PLE_90550 [uncultured Pleomorphomonas sp.]